MLSKDELRQYIARRKYHCPFCVELQKRVAEQGLDAIRAWDGMVCGSVEDMQIRLTEAETGNKYEPVDFYRDIFA